MGWLGGWVFACATRKEGRQEKKRGEGRQKQGRLRRSQVIYPLGWVSLGDVSRLDDFSRLGLFVTQVAKGLAFDAEWWCLY